MEKMGTPRSLPREANVKVTGPGAGCAGALVLWAITVIIVACAVKAVIWVWP